MARREQDREDLLAEATALVERVELRVAAFSSPLVIGFRAQGAASVYFGADPAYHFNARGELRRAHVLGLLYKAEDGKLVSLSRRRSAGEVQLLRRDLTVEETERFLSSLSADLLALGEALNQGRFARVGQRPEGVDVVGRVQAWLAERRGGIEVADSPKVG
ncbi:MAG TPA: hypothetical protein VN699_09775 [Pirellulales bacterium]|nr:hypothetical protein [Pirellulales bacterium]